MKIAFIETPPHHSYFKKRDILFLMWKQLSWLPFLFLLWPEAKAVQDSIPASRTDIERVVVHRGDSINQRYKTLRTGALQTIEVRKLMDELARVNQENAAIASLLDSVKTAEPSDTLFHIAQAHQALVKRLEGLRNTIGVYQQSLASTTADLKQLEQDSFFNSLNREEASSALAVFHQLQSQIGRTAAESQQKLDSLQFLANQSDTVWNAANNLQAELAGVKQQYTSAKRKNNAQFIWAAPKDISPTRVMGSLSNRYQETDAIKHYVLQTEWSGRIFLILLSVGFFCWIYRTGKILWERQLPGNAPQQPYKPFKDMLRAGIFLLTLLPLFSSIIPSLLIQVTQPIIFLLFIPLVRNRFTKIQWRYGTSLLVFYLLVILANSIVNEGLVFRLISLSLNVLALFFGSRLEKGIRLAFIFINLLALFLNVLGFVEYSRYCSIAGAVGLLQFFSLRGFSRMIRQAFVQQFNKSRLTKGLFSRFNQAKTLRMLGRLLKLFCLVLIVIVFAINLHVLQPVQEVLSRFFRANHSLGSITFTYGNLLSCVLVIGAANWLQKNLALFFMGSPTSYEKVVEEPQTLLPLFRLIIVVLGFFFGISALGIGLDKLTVIIGALSVGIGLGLQNIFNNFVSGVILVFEKPFRIGDYIELADRKGKVQQIGIRSSTLLTQEGAEVIIPNGDLLSGRLVNWTLSKSYSKTSISLKVGRPVDMEKVKTIILEEVHRIEYTMKEMDVTIRYQDLSADAITIWVDCWIINIYNERIFRSQLLENLDKRASAEGITLASG
ncbi:mechanosensitive ion channel domain-containing protein [Olivibacter sp. XZL3]|uniref:mechanosensitive ion channel domain-containing protein n=1 Tax=Olivibacter sp. XZL3 TaxID=1735116 RepID=UPI001064E398|nr:mechanosensitive ion channel domain-containing protein [Olivibacter sp. XZL3]